MGPSRWDALAGAGFVAWLVALLWPALPWLQRAWPACHFKAFTGIPCGTCGFTRAFVAAARLDLPTAAGASPLGAAIFLGWMIASVWIATTWLSPAVRLPRLRLPAPVVRFGPLVAFLGNWAVVVALEARG